MNTIVKSRIAAVALLLPLGSPAAARAVSLEVRPNPALVNQAVALRSEGTLVPAGRGLPGAPRAVGVGECGITLEFGDGESTTVLCGSLDVSPCRATATHAYSRPGTYRVNAIGECGPRTGRAFAGPTNAQVSLVVAAGPAPGPPAPPGTLLLGAEPASVRVPRDRGATVPVVYRASGTPAIRATLLSPAGRFEAGGQVVATVETPVSIAVAGGAGTAGESVRFTPQILRDAASRGFSSVSFTRDFAGGGFSARTAVSASIVAPAVEFELERLELSFGNNRPEATVQRGEAGLAARARLRFSGSGLLQAHWEVDGRVLAPPVSRHVALGDVVALASPALPTFDPGTHVVRLVVASPPPPPLPTIVYFVRPSDAAPRPVAIRLAGPAEGETLPYLPALFRWEGAAGAAVYLVQYQEADGGAPVFSAWTRANEYRLPELLYRGVFVAGGRYRWKVSAFNAEENLTGESPAASFSFEQR